MADPTTGQLVGAALGGIALALTGASQPSSSTTHAAPSSTMETALPLLLIGGAVLAVVMILRR